MLYDNIRKELIETPFIHKITKSDLENISKVENWINHRVNKSNDVGELQRLDLLESVIFKLKSALYTETWYNRQCWINDTVRRERIINDLETTNEAFKDDLLYYIGLNSSLVELLVNQKKEILSLQNQVKDLTNHDKSTTKIIRLTSEPSDRDNTDTTITNSQKVKV